MQMFTFLKYGPDLIAILLPQATIPGRIPANTYTPAPQTLALLGFQESTLSDWQQHLLRGAMRCQKDAGTEGSPTEWLREVLVQADLTSPDTQALASTEAATLLCDETLGKAHADRYVCRLAYNYGWLPSDRLREFTEAGSHEYVDEALDYLNEFAVAPGQEITFEAPGDLWLRHKEKAV